MLSVEKHPNADKLSLCRVNSGASEPLQIVCGAPNVRAGMKVLLATVGAQLPGEDGKPFEIKVARMRGVESRGMLCSARELGMSDDHSGLLVLGRRRRSARMREDAGPRRPPFTIKLTPNKADCLSVLGVAREVAALTGAPLTPPWIPTGAGAERRTHPFGI